MALSRPVAGIGEVAPHRSSDALAKQFVVNLRHPLWMLSRQDDLLHELEALYARDFQTYVRVARAITGDRERAVEAVQDAFAQAIDARRSFRGDGPLAAWVWRIVVNGARTAARVPLVEDTLAGVPEPEPPKIGELAPLVAALPERQRHAIFLRYYADLDYRSIATVLGIEVGTVSATLAAGHRAVRRALQEVVGSD